MSNQIQNIEGEDIESIYSIESSEFNNPYIIFDKLKPSLKKPDIKIITSPFDLKELKELGISLYSTEVKKGKTWSPRQKVRYFLRHSDLPSDSNSKEIKKLPMNHVLENDQANNQIRLVGRFISKETNKTEWFSY